MDVKLVENRSTFNSLASNPKAFLEMVPLAAAIWNGPKGLCVINQAAERLMGFSEADLLEDNRLWSSRVYRGDSITLFERQQKMERGNSEITCDYRFYPKKLSEAIWIREVIVPLRDLPLHGRWISFYSDISDLKLPLA